MASVYGSFEDRFKAVPALLAASIAEGNDIGGSIFVNLDGKEVVNIWGGYIDDTRTREWREDTIVNVWSTSKTVVSLAALICIEKGLLDPFEKVARYWPEFGVNGKEDVEVRHLLSHSSGLCGWARKVSVQDICNLDEAVKMLEQQAPMFKPGSASGYHGITMGPLIGALVSRVTGKPFGQFVQEELAQPLDADFQYGVKQADSSRVATLSAPPPWHLPDTEIDYTHPSSSLGNPAMDATEANKPLWRSAELAASNGHSNAAGVGRIMSTISLGGTVGGRQFLSPATIDLIFQEQQNGRDLVVNQNIKWGIGFALTGNGTIMEWLPEGRICTWGGWGGSVVIMDLDRKLTVTYVMNKMDATLLGGTRTKAYVQAVYAALGVAIELPLDM
ncbi:beta-lactamase [Boeremia exigua]|uniref:beta-lactamase n=1 Tax=Boeremia exigua TaxID=749465 RepID=UPI001E8D72F2|nr:beta-lactamase [Boeremia exigua]KAH6632915.1 beta-lactamase [Boeremia exigua]